MPTRLIALAIILTLGMSAAAEAGTKFQIADEVGRNSVTFTSEAPLEDIVGTTNQITGWIEFDPRKPDNGGKGVLVVPVASLDTGIPLRDEHLRSAGWLDAETHPEIKLVIDGLKDVTQVKSGEGFHTFDVVVVGEFSLRGETRPVEVPGRVTFLEESEQTKALMPGDLLAVRASFDVALADHGVTDPTGNDVIGTKVGETVTVDVSFRASNAAE